MSMRMSCMQWSHAASLATCGEQKSLHGSSGFANQKQNRWHHMGIPFIYIYICMPSWQLEGLKRVVHRRFCDMTFDSTFRARIANHCI